MVDPDPRTLSGLYALRGDGVCLAPVVDDGQRLVFDTRREPEPGDYVVLWFRQGAPAGRACWVKRLVAIEPGKIVVDQFNPPAVYVLPASDVIAMHWSTLSIGRPVPLVTHEH